jgi:hypothetical protein
LRRIEKRRAEAKATAGALRRGRRPRRRSGRGQRA